MQQAVVVKLSSPATCHFPGAEYNETKVKEGTAEMVLARNVNQLFLQRTEFLRSIGINVSTDVEQYLISNSRTFDNTKTKKWQFHVALSVREREMSKEQLTDLADRFMQQFGYGQQPYFIYFHHDTDNNHVHILSTNVDRRGHRISDSFDKDRMLDTVEDLLGITMEKRRAEMFGYSFLTEGQFLNIARSSGFSPQREMVDGVDCYTLFRGKLPKMSMPVAEIAAGCKRKDDEVDKRKREQRTRQIRAMMRKYRALSLEQKPSDKPATTKKELQGQKITGLSSLKHKDGTPLSRLEQYQVKWFMSEIKAKLGLDIHFQKDKNGVIRGYGLVDHAKKIAFDGSQVMKLTDILDYSLSQTHTYEKSQTHKGESVLANKDKSSQANTAKYSRQGAAKQPAKPYPYVHDASLDDFKRLFTASVSCSVTGLFVTIRKADGTTDSRPISEEQFLWYSQASTGVERDDIAMKLAIAAFSRELFEMRRQQVVDDYLAHGRLDECINFDKCSIYKHRDGHYVLRVFFKGDYASHQFSLSNEDARSYLSLNTAEEQSEMLRQLIVKYALSGEERQILMSRLRYEEIVPSPFTASSTPSATAAIAQQLHAFLFQTKAALTAPGGAGDENREYEVGDKTGYEASIANESRLSY